MIDRGKPTCSEISMLGCHSVHRSSSMNCA